MAAPPEVARAGETKNRQKARGPVRAKGLLRHASADDDNGGRDSNNYGFLWDFPSWAAHGTPSAALGTGGCGCCADAGTCPPHKRAGSKPAGREGGVGADGLQGCPQPRLPGCRDLERAASGSWDAGERTPTVAFPWEFMQEKPGSETDCLHLFLKEPSSGR